MEERLNGQEINEIYNNEIQDAIFRNLRSVSEGHNPTLIMTPEQPGMDMYQFQKRMNKEHFDGNGTIINWENLSEQYHPKMEKNFDSAQWLMRALDEAQKNRFNVVTDYSTDLVENFKNYDAVFAVPASHQLYLQAGVLEDYVSRASFVRSGNEAFDLSKRDLHNLIPDHFEGYEKRLNDIDKVTKDGKAKVLVYDKQGQVIYDSERSSGSLKSAIEKEEKANLSLSEYNNYIKRIDGLVTEMTDKGANQTNIDIAKSLCTEAGNYLSIADKKKADIDQKVLETYDKVAKDRKGTGSVRDTDVQVSCELLKNGLNGGEVHRAIKDHSSEPAVNKDNYARDVVNEAMGLNRKDGRSHNTGRQGRNDEGR